MGRGFYDRKVRETEAEITRVETERQELQAQEARELIALGLEKLEHPEADFSERRPEIVQRAQDRQPEIDRLSQELEKLEDRLSYYTSQRDR